MNYDKFLTINYPVSGSVFFNTDLIVHYEINKVTYEQIKIAFKIDDGDVLYDDQLSGTFTLSNISEGSHRLNGYLVNKNNIKIPKTDFSISFSNYKNTTNVDKKITHVLKSTIPDFVKEDYPNFVLFLKAYYEWLYSSNNPFYAPLTQEDYKDIDKTPELFVNFFRTQYLKDFPENLTLDKQSGTPLNIKTLIKNISQFYSSKGTEKSIKFLLKILYDSYSEIYYPKVDLFNTSNSLWVKRKSIKFNFYNDKLYDIKNKELILKRGETVLWKAFIEDIEVYRSLYKQVIEIFFTNEEGTLDFNQIFEVDTGEEVVYLTPIKAITGLNISDSGLNYKVGDIIRILNPKESSVKTYDIVATARVTSVGEYGQITNYEFFNFGVVTETDKTYDQYYAETVSDSGTSFSISSTIKDYVCNYPGYWTIKNSHTDITKKLQDNYRYQNLSYVIKTDVAIEKYIQVLKKLAHPAGVAVLGDILLITNLQEPVTTTHGRILYYTPLIGNYIAYRPQTNINLRSPDLFPNGFDPEITIPPQDGTTGDVPHIAINPISDGVESLVFNYIPEGLSDESYINDYWVVYPHANTLINNSTSASNFYDTTILDFVKQVIEQE